MTSDKIILHWLQYSRAHRILWLLIELNIPYELKLYKRTKNYRAPPELLQIHPLGRSPIVEIYPNGDLNEDPIVLTETGYIMNYLLLHYNKEGKLVPISTKDKELVSYYLYYAEGSLQSTLVSLLVLGKSPKIAPWGFQTITGFVSSAIAKGYFIPELLNQLDFLEGQLAKQPGGYFAGPKLSAADIILSFPIYHNIFISPETSKQRIGIEVTSKYPLLYAWSKRISKEHGLEKVDEIIEEKLS